MIRNHRTAQIHTARGGRVHPHAVKTSGIAPERDSLGRRAPNKRTMMARIADAQARQEKAEASSQVFRGPIV